MKEFNLTGSLRQDYGKKAAKALRKQELVPCNLYGAGANVTFAVNVNDVRKLIYTPDTQIVNLSVDGKECKAVVKELQFHPVSEALLHIDFLQVVADKPVTVAIPVQLEGHAEGVKAGGKLQLVTRKLNVKGLYTNLPDRIVVDVTSLGLGKKIQVADLHYDNLEITNVKTQIVAQVKATRQSAQAAQ
ncbi:MAG: 50S ribosomal protein L25/general stress protein Ctc [Paludibacteraceae bacterium]|nr:50S ribosomal protein L25/general stress protein Ctc [Paludibacteraceae bacterium]